MIRPTMRYADAATRRRLYHVCTQSARAMGRGKRSAGTAAVDDLPLSQYLNAYINWKYMKVTFGGMIGALLAYGSYTDSMDQKMVDASAAGAGAKLLLDAAKAEDAMDTSLREVRAALETYDTGSKTELLALEQDMDYMSESSAAMMVENAQNTAIVTESLKVKRTDKVLGAIANKKGLFW